MLKYLIFYNYHTGNFDSFSVEAIIFLQILLCAIAGWAWIAVEPWVGGAILLTEIALANSYLISYNINTIAKRGYKFIGISKAWTAKEAIGYCKQKFNLP